MTLLEFERKAIKAERKFLKIPDGWWGTWNDVTNGTVRVKRIRALYWRVSKNGVEVSRHDSRVFAIAKARRIK